MQVVEQYMQGVYDAGLYPNHYVILEKDGNQVTLECEQSGEVYQALNYGSNDILGLSQHPDVVQAVVEATMKFGTSNNSCQTLCGRNILHRQLEQEISDFKGLPHTYLFLNAWMALQAVMDGFCHLAIPVPGFQNKRETLILTDTHNHGCINSAVTNANNRSGKLLNHSPKVRVKAYRHNDVENLKQKLARFAQPEDRIVLVTDAVFSMDGDVTPLPEIVEVLAAYPGSVLILDEAHSSGALGQTGKGILEHFSITPQQLVDKGIEPVVMTTFSKFAASAGAAISCFSKPFINLLDCCPTSIGTISPAPSVTAAALAAIKQLRQHPELPDQLRQNTRFLRRLLAERQFEVLGETNVVPVILPDEIAPKAFAEYLLKHHGVWVSPVWFIAKPRIRIVANVLHTEQELTRLADVLVQARDHFLAGND